MHSTAIVSAGALLAALLVSPALGNCPLAGNRTLAEAQDPATAPTRKPSQDPKPGYDNTPRLPDGFRVHDKERPRPSAVDPGPAAKTPAAAPADATVLFDGSNLDAWQGNKGEAKWRLVDGTMEVNRTGDIRTKQAFGDCQLHIEWLAPPPKGNGQGRGNSGVFFFGRYEVQVLDSFENPTYADGQAAAIYGQKPPLVNATRPPGQWNVYDIVFVAPRFAADGTLRSPARLTVVHNGIVVQLDEELLGPTSHKRLPKYTAHADRGQIRLQDHGNPVRFRNIWLRPLNLTRPAAGADAPADGR